MTNSHEAFRTKQDQIYESIRSAQRLLGTTAGIASDVTDVPQGAYLIAWRHPEKIAYRLEEISLSICGIARALPYRRENLHSTLSDFGLAANFNVDPRDPEQSAILDLLAKAVKLGIDAAGTQSINNRDIRLDQPITNGRSVIAPGYAEDGLLTINQAVRAASARLQLADGLGLKGSWGAHTTLNRFTTDASPDIAAKVADRLLAIPDIGYSRPASLDVGYLAIDQTGFTFTTHERFSLDGE